LGEGGKPMQSEPCLLSIVIPAFNEEERLPESVRRIREACDAFPQLTYEIIVCDNNSSDGTAAIAAGAGWLLSSNQSTRFQEPGTGGPASLPADGFCSSTLIRGHQPS
jgi:hypothetical protein